MPFESKKARPEPIRQASPMRTRAKPILINDCRWQSHIENGWPGERRVGGVKTYRFCSAKSRRSPSVACGDSSPHRGALGTTNPNFVNKKEASGRRPLKLEITYFTRILPVTTYFMTAAVVISTVMSELARVSTTSRESRDTAIRLLPLPVLKSLAARFLPA